MAQVEVSQFIIEVGFSPVDRVRVSQAIIEIGFSDIAPGQVEVHSTQIGVDAVLDAQALRDEDADVELFFIEGALSVGVTPLRIYNNSGITRFIENVFIAVNTSPAGTGESVIVDVNMDGVSIFNPTSRPEILTGSNTDEAVPDVTNKWEDGSYLTVDVDAVGNTSEPGQDLTVHIIFR